MRAGLANGTGRLARALQARLQAVLPPVPMDVAPDSNCEDTGDAHTAAQPLIVIEDFLEEPWASLTFSGTRHRLDLRLQGGAQAIEQAMGSLSAWTDEDDPLLAGHFLAEVQITETAREICEGGRMSLCLRLDALTIKE